MNRIFDPIDIVFIALITLYFLLLTTIILLWINNNRKYKPIRFKVVQIIHPKKVKKRKKKPQKVVRHVKDEYDLVKKAGINKTKVKSTTIKNNPNQIVRYKGKAPTKKKTTPRKKAPKTNGKNKKRK